MKFKNYVAPPSEMFSCLLPNFSFVQSVFSTLSI
jgi:hypothetical protein